MANKHTNSVIYLYDERGKLIGHKLLNEAYAIAKKNGFELSRKEGEKNAKYLSYMLSDPKQAVKKDDEFTVPDMAQLMESPSEDKKVFTIKDTKRLTVKTNISDHDIQTKCNKVQKWIDDMCEVKVLVSGGYNGASVEALDHIFNLFKKHLPTARFLQRVVKNQQLKFTISPDPKLLKEDLLKSSTESCVNSKQEPEMESDSIDPQELEAEVEKMLRAKPNKK